MATGLSDGTPSARDLDQVTLTGVTVLLLFIIAVVFLYVIVFLNWPSYTLLIQPIHDVSRSIDRLTDAAGYMPYLSIDALYEIFALFGTGLAIIYRKNIRVLDVLFSFILGVLCGIKYDSDLMTGIPLHYYSIYYFSANSFLVIMLMTLGGIGISRSVKITGLRIISRDYSGSAISVLLGAGTGIAAFLLDIVYAIVFIPNAHFSIQNNIFSGGAGNFLLSSLLSLMSYTARGIAFGLLFMSIAYAVLKRYLPEKIAAVSTIVITASFFLSSVPIAFGTSNVINNLIGFGLFFILIGLPTMYLAYKRDTESAIFFIFTYFFMTFLFFPRQLP